MADVDAPAAEANTTADDLAVNPYQTTCRACGTADSMRVVGATVSCSAPLMPDGFCLQEGKNLDTEDETVERVHCGHRAELADYTN